MHRRASNSRNQSTVNVTTDLIAVYKSLDGGWQDDAAATAQN
ncbi:hypothetical protein [Caballeronia glebae]|nr:hypothetical protein [Caballeronia glebae]